VVAAWFQEIAVLPRLVVVYSSDQTTLSPSDSLLPCGWLETCQRSTHEHRQPQQRSLVARKKWARLALPNSLGKLLTLRPPAGERLQILTTNPTAEPRRNAYSSTTQEKSEVNPRFNGHRLITGEPPLVMMDLSRVTRMPLGWTDCCSVCERLPSTTGPFRYERFHRKRQLFWTFSEWTACYKDSQLCRRKLWVSLWQQLPLPREHHLQPSSPS